MAQKPEPEMGVNSWLEEELYREYMRDRSAVDDSWKKLFEHMQPEGGKAKPAAPAVRSGAAPAPSVGEEVVPLRGAATRLAENMEASLSVPVATSQRTVAVKVMDENRRIINQHRGLLGRGKVSFTHLLGWAIVRALGEFPNLNNAWASADGGHGRLVRPAGQPGDRGGCGRARTGPQPARPQHQERRRA